MNLLLYFSAIYGFKTKWCQSFYKHFTLYFHIILFCMQNERQVQVIETH